METTKNDRIKRVIEYKNITQVDLANILGVKKQLVQNWVSNAQPVPDKYILMLIDKYIDIDARWLATGSGTIDGSVATTQEQINRVKKPLLDIIAMKDLIISDKEKMLAMKDDIIKLLKK